MKNDTQSERETAFKRRQIPGLKGLSRGSYDLGWIDGQATSTCAETKQLIDELLSVMILAKQACDMYWFSSHDEESYNNDEIIEASRVLEQAIAKAQSWQKGDKI